MTERIGAPLSHAWATIAAIVRRSDGRVENHALIELCHRCAEDAFARLVDALGARGEGPP